MKITGVASRTTTSHRNLFLFAAAVLATAVAAQQQPSLYDTGVTVLVFALIGTPLALMYGHCGIISLSQGAFAALGGYATAIVTAHYGWSPWTSLILALAVPALVALAIARPILKLPELVLALATLAISQAWELIVALGGEFTGGHVGIFGIPALPFEPDPLGAFLGIAGLVAIAIYAFDNFVRSARGRAANAIRVDTILAQSTGVHVAAHRTTLFVTAAAVAGLAGWYYAHYVGYLAPNSLGFTQSAAILFMVVIGGQRSSLGATVGAVIYVVARDVLPGGEMQGVWFGAMLILVLLLAPGGAASVTDVFTRRYGKRSVTADQASAARDRAVKEVP